MSNLTTTTYQEVLDQKALDPKVLEINLDPIAKRLAKDLEMNIRDTEPMIFAYREFLHDVLSTPGMIHTPGEEADMVWHRHILFTKKYANDCAIVFGYFLHHYPSDNETCEDTDNCTDRA